MNDIINYLDGCFSILITGERGTGKTALLKNELNKWQIRDTGYQLTTTKRGVIEGSRNYSDFPSILKEELLKANGGIFICENIENINRQNQIVLFEHLSTVPGGYYEIFGNEEVRSQIIITSNQRLSELYNQQHYLPLMDRIAQQVVELGPVRSYSLSGKRIKLQEVWAQMQFKLKGEPMEFPGPELNDEFYQWLDKLHLPGNFRDLQKIAIYIWRYRLENFNPGTMVDYVKHKFNPHIYEPENNFFQFNKSAEEIMKEFKYQLANWAERKYPDSKTLLDNLEIAEKTLYNWKNRK